MGGQGKARPTDAIVSTIRAHVDSFAAVATHQYTELSKFAQDKRTTSRREIFSLHGLPVTDTDAFDMVMVNPHLLSSLMLNRSEHQYSTHYMATLHSLLPGWSAKDTEAPPRAIPEKLSLAISVSEAVELASYIQIACMHLLASDAPSINEDLITEMAWQLHPGDAQHRLPSHALYVWVRLDQQAQASSLMQRQIQTGKITAKLYLQKEQLLSAITSGLPHVIRKTPTREGEQWRQTMRVLKKGPGGQYLNEAEAPANSYFEMTNPRLDYNVTNLMMKVVKPLLSRSNQRLSSM